MANEQLRDVLELALINEPEAVTMDLLDKMFKVPFRERYRRLDLPSLLSGGAQVNVNYILLLYSIYQESLNP